MFKIKVNEFRKKQEIRGKKLSIKQLQREKKQEKQKEAGNKARCRIGFIIYAYISN